MHKSSLLFLIVGDEEYGVNRMLASLFATLLPAGIKCSVIAMSGGPLADALARLGADVRILGRSSPPNYKPGFFSRPLSAARVGLHLLRNIVRVAAAIRECPADAMIVRMPNLVPLAAVAGRMSGIRTAWIMPNAVSDNYPLHVNKIVYELLVKVTHLRVIANSAYTASTLLNWFRKPDVLWLGVDESFFKRAGHREAVRSQLGVGPTDIVVGVFARLIADKGQEALIRALPGVLTTRPRVKLLLVGSSPDTAYIDRLRALCSSLNVADAVVFVGAQSDVRPYYEACDITANVRLSPEPFGLSVIESMMLGVPVLAHAAGAPGETVTDGVTGWLYHEPSPQGIEAALVRALNDMHLWPQMSSSAASRARQNFDVRIVARRLVNQLLCLPAHVS